ncbi:MAG TPA: L-aspartate oxidase [Alcaligenes faecalis]|nr:L-aspartate oxidase [Alcaligenes faecalis]
MPRLSTKTDVLIIGAGLAGTSLALSLPASMKATLLSSGAAPCSASTMALGGLAAVLSAQDSVELHIEDTLQAGAHHSDADAVRNILQAAPQAVQWLLERQVPLDRTPDGQLHLTREGGHSQRRIVHAADASGYAIMQALYPQLQQATQLLQRTNCLALALRRNEHGRVAGVDIYDKQTHRHETILADHVVLATGGLGSLYAHSTNPDTAKGEGVALAWRIGAAIRDLEFVQFHPTCLYTQGPTFLLTEALRGEGGHLLDAHGRRFMPDYDSRAELAPRDIVSRAIAAQMKQEDRAHVWLDVRHLGADTLQRHFPRALEEGLRRGLDLRQDWIPVAPAAHYSCGGIQTDLSGRTSVPGLYAIGEVACTGLHGANRLASNSLLECVVMGRAAAQAIEGSRAAHCSALTPEDERSKTAPTFAGSPHTPAPARDNNNNNNNNNITCKDKGTLHRPPTPPFPTLPALQNLMQEHVGLLRNRAGLAHAIHTLSDWREQIRRLPDTVDHRIGSLHLDTAWLLAHAALARPHSLGAHFRLD